MSGVASDGLDTLAERALQLAVVAERLDERSETAAAAVERAARDAGSAAAHLATLGDRVGRDAVQAVARDAAAHLQQAVEAACRQAGAALDAQASRLRELETQTAASRTALAAVHRRWLVVAPALLVIASTLAVAGASAWVAKSRADVAALKRDAAVLAALERADVAVCGDRLCARVEGPAQDRGYRRVAVRR